MLLMNGHSTSKVEASDRAFQYGDGVFTTMLVKNGQVCDWLRHKKRLKDNVATLKIAGVNWGDVTHWVKIVADAVKESERAVMKVMVTRGTGGRGYSPAGCVTPNVVVSTHPFPAHYLSWREDGITMKVLSQRIGLSPIAGLKHLNRLEQVLLKQEVELLGVDDGVACDMNGHVVETSASNIFWRKGKSLYTPPVELAGVAGTMRAQVMDLAVLDGYPIKEVSVTHDELLDADEIFITNAVMGLVPVRCLEGKDYSDFDVCRAITLRLDV